MGANSAQLRLLSSGLALQGSSGFHLSVSKSTEKAKDSSPWSWLGSRNILRGSTYKQAGVCKAEGQRRFGARQSSGPSERAPSSLNSLRTVPRLQKPPAALHPLHHGLWTPGFLPKCHERDSIKLDTSSSSRRSLQAAALSELNSAMALWFIYISDLKLTPISQLQSLPSAQSPQGLTLWLPSCVFVKVSSLQNLNN